MATGQTYINSKGQTVNMSTGQVVTPGANDPVNSAEINARTVPTTVSGYTTQSYGSGANTTYTQTPVTPAPVLGNPVVPTSASAVQQTAAPQLPTPTVPTGNINAATGANTELQALTKSQIAAAVEQDKIATDMAKAESEKSSLLSSFLGNQGKSVAQQRTDLSAEYGIQAKTDEINALSKRYGQLETALNNQIAQTRDVMGSTNFINNQTAQIKRNAEQEMAPLRADINFKTGILTQNQSLIQQAIEDATAEQQYKFDVFRTFLDLNQNEIARLDTKYQNAATQAFNLAKLELDNAQAEKAQIAEWQSTYPNLKFNINGTLADAAKVLQGAGITPPGEFRTVDGVGVVSIKPDGSYTVIVPEGNGVGGTNSANFDEVILNALNDGASVQTAGQAALSLANDLKVKVDLSSLIKRAEDIKAGIEKSKTTSNTPSAPSLVVGAKGTINSPLSPEQASIQRTLSTPITGTPNQDETVGSFFARMFAQ